MALIRGTGRPFVMLSLLGILVAMIVATLVGLYVVNEKHAQFSAPGLHTEVWQSYQLHSETHHLIETAERTLAGETGPRHLIQRLGVMKSLLLPLQRTDVFSSLSEPRPEVEATLDTLQHLADEWSSQLSWQDTTAAERVAGDIVQRLPAVLEDTHHVIVAANIAVANQVDSERQDLKRTFRLLAWTLLVLGAGCIPLMLKLIRDHHSAKRLTQELGAFNQALEQRVAERTRSLNERKALLSTILESSPSDVALIGANDQRVFYVSETLRQHSPNPSAFQLRHLFVDSRQYELFQQRLMTQKALDNWEAQLAPRAPYWALLSVRHLQLESQPVWLIWSLDISERKHMERELKQLASTDTLTGLPNRRTFLLRSLKQLQRADRDGRLCAALAIDIDLFKRINDEYGHQVGDDILRKVAQQLDRHLSDLGIVGRLGGEEFAALLPDVSADDAWQIAETLRNAVKAIRTRTEHGDTLVVTISVGIATHHAGATLKQLLMQADDALYRAKTNGRDCCEYFGHPDTATPTA
ncbi:GGDEF domain-containing protein [Litchfieldella rifensis]|uniref:diguanylate cyclase n=1 Tax=Litchfieldella rifensis TaxID=762643 RepID=A0ABV7LV59_9GAMM